MLRGRPSTYGRGIWEPARHAYGAYTAADAEGGQSSSCCLPLLGEEGENLAHRRGTAVTNLSHEDGHQVYYDMGGFLCGWGVIWVEIIVFAQIRFAPQTFYE